MSVRKEPERVELYVVQYRNKPNTGVPYPSGWVSMSSLYTSYETAEREKGIADDVWNKETRIVRIEGTVVDG